ncbi:MAG: GNAT family N-acetyltransferase [Aestuariibaculum sp.]
MPKSWDTLVSHDIFLSTLYLKALEEASPSNITLYYIAIFKNETIVAALVLQRVTLYVKDMFRNNNDSSFRKRLKNIVSKFLKGHILVVGNLTHTGQHGFFKSDVISDSEFTETIFKSVNAVKQLIKTNRKKNIRLVLFKDYFKDDLLLKQRQEFNHKGFYKVTVQPNMIMPITDNWSTFDDYIKSFNKKYLKRYKTARKKRRGIVCNEMDLEAIKNTSERMYSLYRTVSNNAKFNTFILPENHFVVYKTQLRDRFKVFGYYLNGKLIGFYTLILNYNGDLETYFLGYDKTYQYTNQLYLNMLYDMVQFGIENHFKTIVYARTAMAIKSSVGAKIYPMFMYIRHTNPFINVILKPVFRLMNPKQDWEERHPFS